MDRPPDRAAAHRPTGHADSSFHGSGTGLPRRVAWCRHGPAALVNLKTDSGEYLIKGKQVTGFTNEEEAAVKLTDVVPFLLEDALKRAGGKYIGKPNWQTNVVVDERFVTGQNPASARGVAEAIVQALSTLVVAV